MKGGFFHACVQDVETVKALRLACGILLEVCGWKHDGDKEVRER